MCHPGVGVVPSALTSFRMVLVGYFCRKAVTFDAGADACTLSRLIQMLALASSSTYAVRRKDMARLR